MKIKKYKVIVFLILLALTGAYVFAYAPNLNPFFYLEGALFWAAVITLFAGVFALLHFGELTVQFLDKEQRPFQYVPNQKFPRWVKFLLLVPWLFVVVVFIGSSFIFHATAYRDQLGEAEPVPFSSDMQLADLDQLPIVDEALAVTLADKKLGERAGLGSQVRLGTDAVTIQQIDGELMWAIPLYHRGVFKWITNLSGTQGYILVSATDVNDVRYMEDFKVKYYPGNYLLQDLTRHVRFGGAWVDGITDPTFEIADDGQPYWIYTTYRNLRGFNLPEATGAWVVNATTGQMERYTIETLPTWVDRIQPESFIINQINNKGEFVHGWLNFADKDKFKASPGHMILYNNGHCYLFTGMTSIGADDSAIGFIMVDMVDKDLRVYMMAGATETAAMGSAQGKVQHLGYQATFPLILNIDGQPTYFMALKDATGLIKQYAFVSVVNYSIVGTGETIQEAQSDYLQGLQNSGITVDAQQSQELEELTGTVWRIGAEFDGQQTVYKLVLSERMDTIFRLPGVLSDELALTREGDRVRIGYAPQQAGSVTGSEFDNLAMAQGA